MKKSILKLSLIIVACLSASLTSSAQWYPTVPNPNNPNWGYEYGRRLAEEQQARDRQNPNMCYQIIIESIALGNLDKAADWAESLKYLREGDGYFYSGLVSELQGYSGYAEDEYEYGMEEAGHRGCKIALERIRREGEMTDEQINNVRMYYLNMVNQVTSMSYQITNNIWGGSSSSSSSKRPCPACSDGRGTDQITYAPNYTGGDNSRYCSICGKTGPAHSHHRPLCRVCGGDGYVD